MSDSYVLSETCCSPYSRTFQDRDGRLAFTVTDMEQKPNLLVRLMREPQWSQQHPEIMGPDTCFMYFGPGKSSGYLVYGNGPNQPMNSSVRQKKNVPNTRYFTAQNGKELKWKIVGNYMECSLARTVIATYGPVGFNDKNGITTLTIEQPGLPICTEIVTALLLNRMAQAFGWPASP